MIGTTLLVVYVVGVFYVFANLLSLARYYGNSFFATLSASVIWPLWIFVVYYHIAKYYRKKSKNVSKPNI